jgi:hypothetical protein
MPTQTPPVPDVQAQTRNVRLLSHAGLLPAIAGRALSSLASQMMAVILGWQIYAITGSAFSLGLIGLAQFLPVLALTFVAGSVVDRHDRRAIASSCRPAPPWRVRRHPCCTPHILP